MKYDPLKAYLQAIPQSKRSVAMSFSQIEDLLGDNLPQSAFKYAAWWANQSYGSQAPSWLDAGFIVDEVNLQRRQITFVRGNRTNGRDANNKHAGQGDINDPQPFLQETLLQSGFLRGVPTIPDLRHHASQLAEVVAEGSLLPHPSTVANLGGAAFPSIRDQKNRISIGQIGSEKVFLDDNTTPRWALLWSHGISATAHPKGWTFAHVWPVPKDVKAYTHLANLVMMPEYFSSLTDKDGPLTPYFQFHAWETYHWKPESFPEPSKPLGYTEINWKYFELYPDPKGFIEDRIQTLDNQRTRLLRSLMSIGEVA